MQRSIHLLQNQIILLLKNSYISSIHLRQRAISQIFPILINHTPKYCTVQLLNGIFTINLFYSGYEEFMDVDI